MDSWSSSLENEFGGRCATMGSFSTICKSFHPPLSSLSPFLYPVGLLILRNGCGRGIRFAINDVWAKLSSTEALKEGILALGNGLERFFIGAYIISNSSIPEGATWNCQWFRDYYRILTFIQENLNFLKLKELYFWISYRWNIKRAIIWVSIGMTKIK